MPQHTSPLASGIVGIEEGALDFDRMPEEPAIYRLRSSGQRIMYVGHAGDEGLREALTTLLTGQSMTGVRFVEYEVMTADAAQAAAEAEIDVLKPLYNTGFGRFRNSDVRLPKQARRIRTAMDNP